MERRWFLPAVLFLLAVACLPAANLRADEPKKPTDEEYELYQIFADTIDQVERNYVKDISRRELMEAAIQGVLGKLDPYSNYISPDDIGRFKSTVESQFGGIGIQIGVENGQLKVISPLVGTPAYRAGLESGDLILEIDGQSTENVQIDEAVKRLKGEAGSKVSLSVRHVASGKRETLNITREWVHIDTVLGHHRLPNDAWDFMLDHDKKIGYVRITAFSRDTAQDLKKALVELKAEGLKGLIVDLRFNPGGLLTSAIEVSDLFIADGKIVSTKGRNTPERSWEAEKEGTFEGFPMAVLVNHYSASASEIFSACLQDHHRAVVIGERTWGKGSVQNVIELEGGKSALKLTTASYFRPSGKNIHRFPDSKDSDEWGVMPDPGFELALNRSQTEQLIVDRRRRDILMAHHDKATPEDEAAEGTAADAKDAATKAAEPKDAAAKEGEAKEAGPTPSPETKPDEAKPDEAKPESAKPDEAGAKKDEPKPQEPKSQEPKPQDAKPEEGKPADAPSDEAKPVDAKPADDKPAEEPTDAQPADAPGAKDTPAADANADAAKPDSHAAGFVDLQLQKAVDYLTQELARAE
ncbi:MAG: S41 family peptidase [Pirellulales bacterium]